MRIPAKVAFSPKYRSYGIFGALGLLDHGLPDMVQTWRGGRASMEDGIGGGKEGFRGGDFGVGGERRLGL